MSSTNLWSAVVKQVTSGDTIVLRDKPKDQRPNVKTIVLMNIVAPKLGRKKKEKPDDKDEPYAWEAREYLRKKLIGQEVWFYSKPFPSGDGGKGSGDRERGKIFFPTKDNDVTEELVANGLVKVKKERNVGKGGPDPDIKKLTELEEKAKQEKKGLYSPDADKHVRNVKYIKDNFTNFLAEHGNKPIPAIIEQVRDGPVMVVLDVILLPNYYSIAIAISGIKFLPDSNKEEIKYVIECRLLQQDGVLVVIEKALNNYVAGSVLHPKGNIAELLLKDGRVGCDDRTMISVSTGASKLRAAEAYAKEKRLGCWKNREVPPKTAKKEYPAVVYEIIGGEALMVKPCNGGELKKIFLSSIRAPKEQKKDTGEEINVKDKPRTRTIFDVPWLFETREFLRKKLIGKRVNVIIDYVQPAGKGFPEKTCCTVMIGGNNIAEMLVQNGLATVVRYRQDEENRASHYDALLTAEQKATENRVGMHSKEDPPKHRVSDCAGNRATGLFPMLQKANRITAIVEYVMSGSRMRLYMPKDSLMITFLLSGIQCPRSGFSAKGGGQNSQAAEPLFEEALNFTREKVMQREVEIRIEQHDKVGSMIGTLFIGNTNLALALVEEGLASVHVTSADRALIQAEKIAKEKKIGKWQHVQEEKKDVNEEDVVERKLNYIDCTISVVSPSLNIFVIHADQKAALMEMENKLRAELAANPPVAYSKEKPPLKGRLCAAKFIEDSSWYRGKPEKVTGGSSCQALVYFVDYGNREYVSFEDLAPLPEAYTAVKPFTHEYGLACVDLPPEPYLHDVGSSLFEELGKRELRINIEYYDHNIPYVSIIDANSNEDCIKICIAKGMFYVQQKRKEKKLQSLIEEYMEAQNEAKKNRLLIWEYGDARADDAKEFGLGK